MKHPYRQARARREQEQADDLRFELETIKVAPSVFLMVSGIPQPGPGQGFSYYRNPSGKMYFLTVTGRYILQIPMAEVPPAFWDGPQPHAGQACSISRGRMTQLRQNPPFTIGGSRAWIKKNLSPAVLRNCYVRVPLDDGPNKPAGGLPETELEKLMNRIAGRS